MKIPFLTANRMVEQTANFVFPAPQSSTGDDDGLPIENPKPDLQDENENDLFSYHLSLNFPSNT